jgi:2-keto-4-pentenoate hydratase
VLTINPQTGTSYTLVLTDAGKFVTMTNAAASTLTVPPNSSAAFAAGTQVTGAQLGAGQVTLTPGSGVTINATPGLKVAAQYGSFALIKTGTDTWLAIGRLSA